LHSLDRQIIKLVFLFFHFLISKTWQTKDFSMFARMDSKSYGMD